MDEKEYDPKDDVDFNTIKIAFKVILIIALFLITFSLFSSLVRASGGDLIYTPTNDLFFEVENPTYDEQFNIRNQTSHTGIYNATYTFTNDTDWNDPVDMIITEGIGSAGSVIPSLNGHLKIVRINTTTTGAGHGIDAILMFDEPQTYGTVEFWVNIDNVDASHVSYLRLQNGSVSTIALQAQADKWSYNDGSVHDVPNVNIPLDGIWSHIRMDFELTLGGYLGLAQYKSIFTIGGISSGSLDIKSNEISVDRFRFAVSDYHANYEINVDTLGCSWNSFYNIGDNVFPLIDTLEINEVDRFEFALQSIDVLNPIGLDDPNGWSDIEQTTDTVNIQAGGIGNRSIYMYSNSEYFGLVRSDFNDLENTNDTQRIEVSFNWSAIDIAPIFVKSDFEIRSSDNTLIARVRLSFDGNPAFIYKLQYYDGGGYVDLDSNVESWYDGGVYYDFKIFIDYPTNMVTLSFNDGTNDVFYLFPTIATGKSGLREVRYYNDKITATILFGVTLDSIGVYCDGLAINDEWGWKSIKLPNNWNIEHNNLLEGDYTRWANVSVSEGIYDVGISDFYHLFDMYFNNFFYEFTLINLYAQYVAPIEVPYLIMYQINAIDYILGWTDVRGFDVANLTIEGVKLVEGSNEYPLVYSYAIGHTDPYANYFYVSGTRLYFTLTCLDSSLEYIQANFDINDISAVNRSVKGNVLLEGFPFLYGESAFSLKFTDATTLSFVFIGGIDEIGQIIPQDKVLDEFSFLITDDDRDVASGNTMTGYLESIVLVYYPNLAITILSEDLLMMLIPLFVLILPPVALYKKFGYKIVIPMMMVMSIVSVASGLIPYWMFFVLIFCFVSFILVQRRSEGGGFL